MYAGLPWWLSSRESACQCSKHRFHPWVRKMPWRRKWLRTTVFLPEKSHGQRSLEGYGLGSCKTSDIFQWQTTTYVCKKGNSASRNKHWWWCSMPRARMWRRLWGECFLPGNCPDVLIRLSVVSAEEVKCFDFLLGRLNPNMLWKKCALDYFELFSCSVVSNSLQSRASQASLAFTVSACILCQIQLWISGSLLTSLSSGWYGHLFYPPHQVSFQGGEWGRAWAILLTTISNGKLSSVPWMSPHIWAGHFWDCHSLQWCLGDFI